MRIVSCRWIGAQRRRLRSFGCTRNDQAARCTLGDALIAGTAKAHDLAVATRNVTDFDSRDVNVTNPWEDADRSGEEAGADTAPPLPSVEDEAR